MAPIPPSREDPPALPQGLAWTWGMTLGCLVYIATQSPVFGAVTPTEWGERVALALPDWENLEANDSRAHPTKVRIA